MVKDLGRTPLILKRSFTGIRVIDGMELVCCGGYNLEKRRRRLQPREAAVAAVTT
jgi:hypothetical protein